jgi:hypothetical protein
MPQRQDYVMRMIEELNQFLAEVLRFRRAGRFDAALLVLLQAQQRLFARPIDQFMAMSIEEQVRLLALDETAPHAREKCLAYANLLTEAADTYEAKDQAALAHGAHQLALQVILLAVSRFPPADSAPDRVRIQALLDRLPAGELNAEVSGRLQPLPPGTGAG